MPGVVKAIHIEEDADTANPFERRLYRISAQAEPHRDHRHQDRSRVRGAKSEGCELAENEKSRETQQSLHFPAGAKGP
jgi:hypothetical protein